MIRRFGLVVALAATCGCGSQPAGPVPSPQKPDITAVRPFGVADPAAVQPDKPCQPPLSYRPGRRPAPGAMPPGSTMAGIKRRGRLVVGIGQSAYLLSFREPYSRETRGFEVDIAREIAFAIFGDRHSARIQYRTLDAKARPSAVQDHSVDMVIAAVTINCERWEQVAFSADYYTAGQRLLVNRDSNIRSLADLDGRKVCASEGGTNLPVIARLRPKAIRVSAPNTSDCLVMLQQRQVDAISSGDRLLAGLAAQDPGTEIVGDRFTNEPTGVMIHQEWIDLVRFVNGVLERLVADGTWARLHRQWLFGQIGPAAPPVARYRLE